MKEGPVSLIFQSSLLRCISMKFQSGAGQASRVRRPVGWPRALRMLSLVTKGAASKVGR